MARAMLRPGWHSVTKWDWNDFFAICAEREHCTWRDGINGYEEAEWVLRDKP